MIHWDDRGPQSWNGVHVTHRTTVAELIDRIEQEYRPLEQALSALRSESPA